MQIIKIVAFAPHPDDVTYGCGGSMMKWLEEGHDVHVIWFTDGRACFRKIREVGNFDFSKFMAKSEDQIAKIRFNEANNAADHLGIKNDNRHFLNYYDQDLMNNVDAAVEKIKDLVKNSDRFIIPSDNNNHADHQATHDIAINVARKYNNTVEFYIYALYNILKAKGEHLIKISIGELGFKLHDALKCHESQLISHIGARRIKRRKFEKFGVFRLEDKNKFYNF